MNRLVVELVVMMMVAVCAMADAADLPRMGLDVSFDQQNKCEGVSPEIRLTNVPSGVASYEVHMTDLDVPSFRHWNQTLPAKATVIAQGAGSGYYGPCPPSGRHRYEITVTARDQQGKTLAYGEKTVVAGR